MSKFTLKTRIMLNNYLRHGLTYREISEEINKAISSISEEINKNGGREFYNGWAADAAAEIRRKQRSKRKKLDISIGLKRYIIEKLKEDWSPEQISGELKRLSKGKAVVSHETIYQFIYSEEGKELELWKHLRHRSKYVEAKRRSWSGRRRRGPTIPNRVSIHKRPAEVDSKETFGHWEADLMVFSHSRSTLSVFVERSTKQTISFVNEDKGSVQMKLALHAFVEQAGVNNIKTITFDNGLENVCHEEIRKEYCYSFDTYFCDPYCSWQKGLVENTNKLLRQYFPRKMAKEDITQDKLDETVCTLNNRPRKLLNFNTPLSAFTSCSV